MVNFVAIAFNGNNAVIIEKTKADVKRLYIHDLSQEYNNFLQLSHWRKNQAWSSFLNEIIPRLNLGIILHSSNDPVHESGIKLTFYFATAFILTN